MKSKFIELVLLLIVFGSGQSNASAQELKKSDLLAYADNMFNREHSSEFIPSKPDAVNLRVIRNFMKEFPDVSNETWSIMDNGCYFVRFTKTEISYRVEYNQKGHWLSTTKVYGPKNLASSVQQSVMSNYHDYKIYCVVEVNVGSRTAFYITLEDESSWLKIRLMGDKIEELESYRKG
jgi:hypothetical protein